MQYSLTSAKSGININLSKRNDANNWRVKMKVTNIEVTRINERRAMRGADAVEIKVTYDDGDYDLLWNSRSDLIKNSKQFPEFADELKKGIDFYG